MTMSSLLAACYPRDVRVRWGEDLRYEIEHAGPRRWVNAATGAVDLWLHPALWPAPTAVRRRAVLATLGAALLAATALLLRATDTAPTSDALRMLNTLSVVGMALGTVALCPTPKVTRSIVARLASQCAARLWLPTAAFATLVAVAHRPDIDQHLANPFVHVILFVAYWTTLCTGAIQVCRLCVVAMATEVAHAPSRWATRAGLGLVTASLVVAAVVEACARTAGAAALITTVLLGGMAAVSAHNLMLDVGRDDNLAT